MHEQTMEFSVVRDKETELKKTLTIIYDALKEKGYNPINQIVGYILSEDPTYITTYNNARSLIRHIDRDELFTGIGQVLSSGIRNSSGGMIYFIPLFYFYIKNYCHFRVYEL